MIAQFALETLGYGLLVPAGVAAAVLLLARKLLPAGLSSRNATAVGFAAGFVAGYVLLPEWAPLLPERHWHWLPWLAVLAGVTGPIGQARGVTRLERWLLLALTAGIAAWLLMPTWSTLQPPRTTFIPLLAGGLFLLAALAEPLPARISGPRLLSFFCGVAVILAGLIAYHVSVTHARVAGLAAAALGGVCVASMFQKDADSTPGSIPAVAIVLGGCAFIGCIEPQEPLYALLLIPPAVLALWVCTIGPLSRLRGFRALAVQMLALAVPVLAAVVLLHQSSSGVFDE